MCQGVAIPLFGQENCICHVYPEENIEIEFNRSIYNNVTVYRPNHDNIPRNLSPEYKECLKNAFYVSRFYNVRIVEGVIVIRVETSPEAIVQAHCWNFDGVHHFDVTPFILAPQNITYIPYKNDYIWRDYRNKFGGNTSQYTFLNGRTILQFEEAIKGAANIQ